MNDIDHGGMLTRFLEQEWDAQGETRGGWCRKHGLSDSTVLRWSRGNEPDLRSLLLIAEALRRPLVHILIAAGYLTEEQARVKVAPVERPDIAQLIATDKTISRQEREALLHIHEAFRAVELGETSAVHVKRTARVSRVRQPGKAAGKA